MELIRMFCQQCSGKIEEGSTFCEECGAKVESAPSAPGEAVPDPASALPPRAPASPSRLEAWRAIWLIGLVLTLLALMLPWLEIEIGDVRSHLEVRGYWLFFVSLYALPAKLFNTIIFGYLQSVSWWLLPWTILILLDTPFIVRPLQSRGRPMFAFLAALAGVGLYLFRWQIQMDVLTRWAWAPGFWLAMVGTILIGLGALVQLFENARENIGAPSGVAPVLEARLKNFWGVEVSLAQLYGKVVLVNLWTTSCEPCRTEIPELIELQHEYHERGFTVVGVAMDEEGRAVVEPYIQNERFNVNGQYVRINYPVLLGNDAAAQQFGRVFAIPTSVLISRGGQVVKRYIGLTNREDLRKEIERLV